MKKIICFILSAFMIFELFFSSSSNLFNVNSYAETLENEDNTASVTDADYDSLVDITATPFPEDEIDSVPSENSDAEQPKLKVTYEPRAIKNGSYDQDDLKELGYIVPGMSKISKDKESSAKIINNAKSSDNMIVNDYVEIAVAEDGKFTIGNVEGNENYTTDNNKILLYDHPYPGTSKTLIKVDDNEMFFKADSVDYDGDKVFAYMNISEFGIQIVQILSFVTSKSGNADTVSVSYKVINTSSQSHKVGIRIMMDTMLNDNDYAPFKVTGTGNLTTQKAYKGAQIPKSYQVYDDFDSPTTIATGIVYENGKKPDAVFFTNWPSIEDAGWDYYPAEGEALGDSAVAMLYNPVTLSRGASYDVCTYYGAGIGSSISGEGSTSLVGKDQIGITVVNRKDNSVIENAEVCVTDLVTGKEYKGTTNSKGKATLNGTSAVNGFCSILIKHSSFATLNKKVSLKSGHAYTYKLSTEADYKDIPDITSVTLDGKNILTKSVTYAENLDGVVPNATNSKVVKLKVEGDSEDLIYQLINNGTVFQNSTDGEFNLTEILKDKKGKSYSKKRIDGLSAGNKIYVQAISKDGKKSDKIRIGLNINKPSGFEPVEENNKITLGQSIKFNPGSKNLNAVEKFFLGDSEFSLGFGDFPISAEISDDGKVKLYVNKSTDDKNFKQTFDDIKKKAKTYKNGMDAMKAFDSNSFTPASKASFDFYFIGYGEGYLHDGQVIINLDCIAYFKGSKSWTTYWSLGPVPVYVKTTLEGKLQTELLFNCRNENGWKFECTKGILEPSVTGRLEVGAGISGVASVGIEGSGDICFHTNLASKYYKWSTTLAAAFKAKALFFEYNKTIAKYTIVWTDGYYNKGKSSEINRGASPDFQLEFGDTEDYKMMSRSYIDFRKNNLNRAFSSEDTEYSTIMNGAFPDAAPRFVKVGGKYYAFWIEDANNVDGIDDRTSENRTVLVYREYYPLSDTWSEIFAVNDDGTADFSYDLAVDGSDIYVVWQNTNKVFDDSDINLDDCFAAMNISATKINTLNNSKTNYNVSSTNKADLYPRVSVHSGDARIVWYSAPDEHVLKGSEEGYQINYGKLLSNGTYDEINTFNLDEFISDLDLGYLDDDFRIVVDVDKNNDFNDSEDRELIIFNSLLTSYSKVKSDSYGDISPMFVKNDNGCDTLYWYNSGEILYTDDLSGFNTVKSSTDVVISPNYSVITDDNGKNKKIVWTSYSGNGQISDNYEDNTKSIYTVDYDYSNGLWSEAYELCKLDEGTASNLSGLIDNSGKEIVVTQNLKYVENTEKDESGIEEQDVSELISSDIVLLSSIKRKSIRFNSVDYDIHNVKGGSVLPVKINVTNVGNQTIDTISVNIGSYSEDVDINLEPGMTGEFNVNSFVVPESDYGESIDVEISGSDDELYVDYSDKDSAVIYIGYTDICAEEDGREMIDGVEYARLVVSNNSSVDADTVNIKLIADEKEGEILFDYFIDKIEAHSSKTIYCPTDYLDYVSVVNIRLTTQTDELFLEDNSGIIAVSGESRDLDRNVKVSVKSNDESKGTVTCEDDLADLLPHGAEIALKAHAKSGYVFTGWSETTDDEAGGTFYNQNSSDTTYVVPNRDVIVEAGFSAYNPSSEIIATDQTDIEVNSDESIQLKPQLITDNGVKSSDYIKWVSSDESVVSVDQNGNIITNNEGTATVTAIVVRRTTDGEVETDISIDYNINVVIPPTESIMIVEKDVEIEGIGAEYNLSKNILASPLKSKGTIIYSSDNEKVATVDENGIVTTHSEGLATISAKLDSSDDEGISSCDISVVNPLTSVSIDKSCIITEYGDVNTLNITTEPEDYKGELDIKWRALDSSVVQVSGNGRRATVKSVGKGTTTVVATVNGISLYTVVVSRLYAKSINLSPTAITIGKDESYELSYSLTPEGTEEGITFSSSNTDVADVTYYGVVTGISEGNAIITATTSNGLTATCNVTVLPYGKVIDTSSATEVYYPKSLLNLESKHNYDDDSRIKWVYTSPGASKIEIHFSGASCLEYGYDYLYVLNGSENQIEKLTGDFGGEWVTIPGDTVILYLETDEGDNEWGFKIDRVSIDDNGNESNEKTDSDSSRTTNPTPNIPGQINPQNPGMAVGGTVPAATIEFKSGKGRYSLNTGNNSVTYLGPTSKKVKTVVIPSTVKRSGATYKVVAIGNGAFSGCSKLKKVTIGKNVVSIGSKAFYKNKKLNKVIFKGKNIKLIGKSAFKGIAAKPTFKMPSKVLKKYKKMIKKSGAPKKSKYKK